MAMYTPHAHAVFSALTRDLSPECKRAIDECVVALQREGILTHESLAFDLDNDTVLFRAPAGTRVGTIAASAGRFTAPPTLVDDHGGRFAIGPEEDGKYPLLTTGTAPVDFENEVKPAFPLTRYQVTVCGIDPISRAEVVKTFALRMECPRIEPTGAGANPEKTTNATSQSAFRQAVNNSTGNHLIRSSSSGVWPLGGNLATTLKADNVTIALPHRLIPLRGGTLDIGAGKNIRVRGGNLRCGGDPVGISLDNRDALVCGHQSLPTEEILFENMTPANSVDELASVISPGTGPWVRLIRFYRCRFTEPLFDAGHSKGSHPFGLLFYNSHLIVVVHECLFDGCGQRSPMIGLRNRGVHCFNNVVIWRGNVANTGGTMFAASGQSTVQNGQGGTVICEGNLYYALEGPEHEKRSLMLRNCGSGSEFYIPEGTDYDNQYIRFADGTWDFTPRPIPRSAITLDDGSTTASIVDSPPFKPADYGMMKTGTAELNQALFEHVLNNAGTRAKDANGDFLSGDENLPKVDRDSMALIRTQGKARRQTPTTLESQYGADWAGMIAA